MCRICIECQYGESLGFVSYVGPDVHITNYNAQMAPDPLDTSIAVVAFFADCTLYGFGFFQETAQR